MSRSKYILVAEDDKFYANIYQTKLTNEGFQVIVVNNGKDALVKIKRKKPDLFLLDLIMPVKDGFQVLKELKQSKKNIKIIALTNLDSEASSEELKNLGVLECIVKSDISIQDLMDKINKYL